MSHFWQKLPILTITKNGKEKKNCRKIDKLKILTTKKEKELCPLTDPT